MREIQITQILIVSLTISYIFLCFCLASLDRIFRTIIVVVLLIATNEEKGKPHLMART